MVCSLYITTPTKKKHSNICDATYAPAKSTKVRADTAARGNHARVVHCVACHPAHLGTLYYQLMVTESAHWTDRQYPF